MNGITSRVSDWFLLLRRVLLAIPIGLVTGSASALFLASLDWATRTQWAHPQLLWGLPLAGMAAGWLYHHYGKDSGRGTNLLIDEIHQPGGGVPARMAPLVLLGTLVTHLFGGSAGREGTAVQMGGSLAGLMSRSFKLGTESRKLLLMCGIAAGFGSVFGTPVAGAIFALEVLVIGKIHYAALLPVLVSSVVGDMTCSAWGIHHTPYYLDVSAAAGTKAALDLSLLMKVALAAVIFGFMAQLFSKLTHSIQHTLGSWINYPPLRPAIGGLIVILMVYLLDTRDYLGLGVEPPSPGGVSIVSSFETGGVTTWSWLWKTLFTAVTLGSGFKGGEVTPLFFIGSSLGHVLGLLFQEPVALFAALGFIAVFAGAANTPLACTLMGIELFGAHYALYFAVACFIAYTFSGQTGIYSAQRIELFKKIGASG